MSLLTDLYELTMMQGYFLHHKNPEAVFDMFFRRQPFGSGFSVVAGLEDALRHLSDLTFGPDEISYLRSLGTFREEFLDWLAAFRFRGDVYAMEEGEIAFPGEPIVQVRGSLAETQLVESALLNTVNFQTLVATKAARICLSAKGGSLIEFGLRRAQGPNGALCASRAAYIGGAAATSNTEAGHRLGIPVSGTMAHSWVMSFDSERDAFERYADVYPEGCILLVDTYDTLGSGMRNAIAVGKRLAREGHRGFGVRLDSGDLEYLSKKVREQLNAAGLTDARIVVSNELDEHIIEQLVARGAAINAWGVGTNLVTAAGDPALTGVYKIAAKKEAGAWVPTMKVSNNPEKVTNPGVKQVWRFFSPNNGPLADLICLDDEDIGCGAAYTFHHPGDYRSFVLRDYATVRPLLTKVMESGKRIGAAPSLANIRAKVAANLASLDDTYKRLINPHVYKVSLSSRMKEMKLDLIQHAMHQEEDR